MKYHVRYGTVSYSNFLKDFTVGFVHWTESFYEAKKLTREELHILFAVLLKDFPHIPFTVVPLDDQ